MITSHHEIVTRVRAYIAEQFLYMRQNCVFEDNDSLLGLGIIDSLGVVELISFIQEEYGVAIDDSEITEENLGSIWSIARFVAAKQGTQVAAW